MIFSLLIIFVGLCLLILNIFVGKINNNYPTPIEKKDSSICFLIPARDESNVIENLLLSIKKQTHKIKMQDVLVIVEDDKDKTIDICKKYNVSYFVRKKLNLKRKGYALDEGIKYLIKSKKKYDLYFVFDADNVLDEKYVDEMLKSYEKGYDLSIGYRNSKNGNENTITACSSLTFSMINQLFNSNKDKHTVNITISGTGFYIRGELIDKWKGYPFHTLTEDYELTLYSILNDLTTNYNKKAIYYDEQPITMSQSIKQRTRWVKGFFEARKKYISKIRKNLHFPSKNKGSKRNAIHIIRDIIVIVFGLALLLVITLLKFLLQSLTKGLIYNMYFWLLLFIIILVYVVLLILTILILKCEERKLKLNKKSKLKTILFNPIFLITYLICVYKALFSKNLGWDKIEHIG